jgi:hypothetical protein
MIASRERKRKKAEKKENINKWDSPQQF